MKIAVLAPFEESVPPKKYGGTELVVYNLVKNLKKRGCEVTLLATGDSKVNVKLVSIFPRSIRFLSQAENLRFRDALKYVGIAKVVENLINERYDIIHNHIGWRFLPFEKIVKSPVVTTLHGPLNVPYQKEIYSYFSGSRYISISYSQRRPLPDLNYVGNVYNGIDLKIFPFSNRPQDYFAFLARMSPEKGPIEAIKIAKKAKINLIMAAKVDSVDKEYFAKKVKPLIDGKCVRFLGEIGHKEKVKLLKNAKALIAPIQWEEPFGLFFIESMACGTPVVTLRRGSAPEVIVDGKTGYVCHSLEEAVKKIKEIGKIERYACREHVEKNFSAEKMTDNYLEIYKRVMNNRTNKNH